MDKKLIVLAVTSSVLVGCTIAFLARHPADPGPGGVDAERLGSQTPPAVPGQRSGPASSPASPSPDGTTAPLTSPSSVIPGPVPGTSAPAVFFQNRGTVQGWSNYPQQPQKQGVIRTVTGPAYHEETSIEAQQTYLDGQGGGYHSETIQARAQRVGEDRYFGQSIYVRPDWTFHSQNVTFQQFSPENPEGPWLLMFIQNDELRYSGHTVGSARIGSIADLRGTWIRVVTRLRLTRPDGVFQVWVNGKRLVSRVGDIQPPGTSIRWSSGIYCTAWRYGPPAGPHLLSIFHAHARIASTYSLAEPANW